MNSGKSHVRSEHVDEMLLVRYLLGDLTEEEQGQVEDRVFEDSEYLGALEAAEADLIDSYVRGELSRLERRFECRFLTSPQRQSKVEFARALAMLDLTMPVMGGERAFDLLRNIRPDVPVVAASGYDESDAIARIADKEFAGFLQKPFEVDRLIETVASALGMVEE
jgi:CheY-like chemotaxis protein